MAQDFAETFNRLMQGKATAYGSAPSFGPSSVQGQINASTSAKNRKPKITDKKPTAAKKTTNPVDEVAKQEYLKARAEEMQKDAEDLPWYKDALNVVAKPLDVLNRPAATVVNSIQGGAEALLQGEPIWSLPDDMLYGGWRGLSGQDKDGYGDLHQTMKDLVAGEGENTGTANRIGRNLFGSGLFGGAAAASNKLDQKFGEGNEASKWFDRGVGLVGDVATDPTTYIGVGVATKAAKGIGAKIGINAADEAVVKAARAVDKANNLATAASKANKAGNSALQQRALAAKTNATKLMDEVRAKGYKIQVPDEQFTSKYIRTGGPTGKDAWRASTNLTIDNIADQYSFLKNPLDKDAARTVQRSRLIDDLDNGALAPDEFLDQYAKVSPSSTVVKALKAGKITAEEAVDRIKVFRPILDQGTKDLARSGLQVIQDVVQKKLDQVGYDIQGGGIKGKTIGTPREIVPTLANTITEEAKYAMLYDTNKRIDKFLDHVETLNKTGKGKLSPAEIKAMSASDPMFKTWQDTYIKHYQRQSAKFTKEQIADRASRRAHAEVARMVEDELTTIHSLALESLRDTIERAPVLRVFGKEIKTFPEVGAVGRKLGSGFNDSRFGESFNKAFRYSSNFPGYTTFLGNRSTSLGVRAYEDFKTNVAKFVKDNNVTSAEAKQLQRNLEQGIVGTGKMKVAYEFLRKEYDEIYAQEIAAGIREAKRSARLTDYAYTHVYPKKTRKAINEITAKRSGAVKKNGTLQGFMTDDLKAAGHKVEEDAFTNLLYRRMKSNRQLTKAYFYKDLVTHYGIKGRYLSKDEMARRGLMPVPARSKDFIMKDIQGTLKPGEALYMDKSMAQVYNSFSELQKNSDEIIRALDYVTRKFKTWNTIYFPAYHVRNMVGDMFMGALDGVKTSDYAKVMKNWFNKNTSTIAVGGETVQYNRLLETFEKNLSSGTYVDAELGRGISKGRTVPAMARQASEMREDFGRFVHFYRAMDDEYGALLKKKVSKEDAWEQATIQAIARVNHFKFDYRALTPFETKYVRRGIPFYTYTRKAVPTLLESLMLQPRYLVTLNRWQQELGDRYDTTTIPDWMRELGYMKITDSWGMGADLLPTTVIDKALNNPAASMNPLIQIPFEMQTGQDLFSGKPVDGIKDVLMNKWRGFNLIKPGNEEGMLERQDKPLAEKILRLAGLPVSKIDTAEANQAFAEIRYKIVGQIEDMNARLDKKGYSIYLSDRNEGMTIRIKDKVSGEVIWEGDSLAAARSQVADL